MKLKILSALFLVIFPFTAWGEVPVKWEYAKYNEYINISDFELVINGHLYAESSGAKLVDDIGGSHTNLGTLGYQADLFSTLGNQGWELVTTIPDGDGRCYLFKRPVPAQALSSQP